MPSSSDEARNEWWLDTCVDGVSSAENYLKERGYKLEIPRYNWIRPQPPRVATFKEIRAIRYLMEEWDYGGLEPYSVEDHCKVVDRFVSGFGFDSEGVRNRYKKERRSENEKQDR